MKKLKVLIIIGLCLLILAGCADDERRARAYFEDGNYQEVVSLLADNEERSEELEEIYLMSRAMVAFENESYREVIELLEDIENDHVAEIRQHSYYAVYWEEISQKMNDHDAEGMFELYLTAQGLLNDELQEQLNQTLLEEIAPRLTVMEIDNFFTITEFVRLLNEDENFKELAAEIDQELQENEENKLRAFLNRPWIRQDDSPTSGLRITVNFANGNNFATVDEDFDYFERDDIKWREIQYVNATTFRFEDLAKGPYDSFYAEALGRIDFAENRITVSVTAANVTGSNQILVPFVD